MSEFFNNIRIATEKDTKTRWCGAKPGVRFRCGFCGHKIQAAEKFLILYTNDMKGAWGNPLICHHCLDRFNENLEDMRQHWKKKHSEWNAILNSDEMWWFKSHMESY